jgi:hypothetical protein
MNTRFWSDTGNTTALILYKAHTLVFKMNHYGQFLAYETDFDEYVIWNVTGFRQYWMLDIDISPS